MVPRIYYPNAGFPQGGCMTLGFSQLVLGDVVELKGPVGHLIWKGKGMVTLHGEEKHVTEIGLVCGGSGITPVLQLLRAILTSALDGCCYTKVWVLDVNRFKEDILCQEELDQLASEHESRFRLHYSLTGKPVPSDWSYSTGRITSEILRAHLPTPGKDKLVCVCGPSPMEQSVKSKCFLFKKVQSGLADHLPFLIWKSWFFRFPLSDRMGLVETSCTLLIVVTCSDTGSKNSNKLQYYHHGVLMVKLAIQLRNSTHKPEAWKRLTFSVV
jgi:hypothetical protein